MLKGNSGMPQKLLKGCKGKAKCECECEGKDGEEKEIEMIVGGTGPAKEPKKILKKGKR